MSTMMGLDIETIEHLDFDFEEPCADVECDNVADWAVIVKCCGAIQFLCDPCKEELVSWGSNVTHSKPHGGCGAETTYRLERIRG